MGFTTEEAMTGRVCRGDRKGGLCSNRARCRSLPTEKSFSLSISQIKHPKMLEEISILSYLLIRLQ